MRRSVVCLSGLVLIAGSALAGPNLSPQAGVARALDGSEAVNLPANLIGFSANRGELDEIVGDTVIVDSSSWDAQHNGGTGRSIGFSNGDPWSTYFIFTKLDGLADGNPRKVRWARITDNGAGGFTVDPTPPGDIAANANRAGYATLAFDHEDNIGLPTFHVSYDNGVTFTSSVYGPNPFIPGLFNTLESPNMLVNPTIWPHSVWGNTGHVHMISHEQRTDNNAATTNLMYTRFEYNAVSSTFTITNSGGVPESILDYAMNISSDITTNMSGEKVAMGCAVSRLSTLGEDFGDVGQDDQWNNDVYVFTSDDAGLTWNDPIDVTQFIGPNADLFPDTTAANGDTMRVYTDCSVIYDSEDRLHVAFSTPLLDFWRQIGYFESRIFHWMQDDNGDDWWTMINHRPFRGGAEAWGRTTDRPSLYHDMDTDILWCVFREVDFGPDTTDWGESGLANADIWVSASPPGSYNGLLWTKPVNITNTKWLDPGPAPVGECRSETDPNVALRSEGDWLHIQYLLDLDAGTAIGGQGQGTHTDNPLVYHRVAKDALIDIFEANAEWLPNSPIHIDESGFWQDPGNYDWEAWGGFFTVDNRGVGVADGNAVSPHEFSLHQNYPNPFNPSTKLTFSLGARADVKLAVFDVLGREVATLVNRTMNAGSHNVIFFANDLPSGVYFAKLQAGGQEQTRKMVMMK